MSTTVTSATAGLPTRVFTSSIGKKVLMAVSGFVAFGYVVGHMIGNLQIFIGRDTLNDYAEFLHSLGPMLWVIRLVLLAFFVVHIWMGIQLKAENLAARPEAYRRKDSVQASLSSRWMIVSGLAVLAFFVYHILHFTARVTDPRFENLIDPQGRYDVYSMVILGFQNYWVSAVYIVGVFFVSWHISHGFKSMWQSMGWNRPSVEKILGPLGVLIAVILFIGYVSIPVAILAGWITLPQGVNVI